MDMLHRTKGVVLITIALLAGQAQAATFYSRATGNWTAPSTWSQVGYGGAASATYPGQSGPGDVVFISGHTVNVAVTPPNAIGSITLDQLGTAALTKLVLGTAGVVLTCSSFTMGDNNVDQHMELEVSSTALLQVNGPFQATRSAANDRNKRLRVYVLGNGRITTTGNFTYTYIRANGESEMEILLDASGRLDVGGNLSCTIGESTHGNDLFTLQMNGTSQVNVAGTSTFLIQNTTDGDDLTIDLNGGTFTSSGVMSIASAATATSSSDLIVDIDGASLNANGGLTRSVGGAGLCNLRLNANATAIPATLQVGGLFSMDHALQAGMDLTQVNANSTVQVEGNLVSTFLEGGSDDQIFDLNGGSFNVNGNYIQTVDGGVAAQKYLVKLDNDARLNVGGNMTITMPTGNSLQISLNTASGTTAKLVVNGNLTIDKRAAAGEVKILQKRSSLIQVDGNMNLFLEAGNDQYVYQLENDLNRLVVGGSLRAELRSGPGTSDKLDWNGLGGTITVAGNVDFMHAAGDDITITCKGPEVFTIGGRLNIQHTGGDDLELKVDNTASLIVGTDVILNDASTASSLTNFILAGNATARVNGALTMTATAGAELLLDLRNNSKLFLKGSLLRQAAPLKFGTIHMDNTAFIELNGSSNAQEITDDAGNGGDVVGYTNLIVNNTFGTRPQVTTIGTTSIIKTLTLTTGVIRTTATTLLVINQGATCTQGNAGSYVGGPMKKIGKDPFVFPVGNNGRWMRLGMENISNANDQTEFICQYFNQPSPNNSPPFYGTGIHHVSFIEYWDLNRFLDASNDASCNVRLFWEDAITSDINTSALADLRVGHFRSTTSKWESQGGSASGGLSGSVVSTIPLVAFSPISLATAVGLNPLPIELVDFHGTPVDGTVRLEWLTASEVNNDHFEVERSADGSVFHSIATVAGIGNSTNPTHYATTDTDPYPGTNYYRLKQVDHDGTSTASAVIAVQMPSAAGVGPTVFPNPGMEELTVTLNLPDDQWVTLELVDALGRVVTQQQRSLSGAASMHLATNGLPIGSYGVVIRSDKELLGKTRWLKIQ